MTDTAMPAAPGAATDAGGRPTLALPTSALVRISLFWLGLTSIDAVVTAAVQARIAFDGLAAPGTEGTALAFVGAAAFVFAIVVQPTVGSISDYASTRWGRRKPFIVFGAVFDAVFLIGIATANSLVALAALVALLALSTNIARGPFQGYVPDLVPDPQVGQASAMVGLMQVLGNVVGICPCGDRDEPRQCRSRNPRDRGHRVRDDAERRHRRPERSPLQSHGRVDPG